MILTLLSLAKPSPRTRGIVVGSSLGRVSVQVLAISWTGSTTAASANELSIKLIIVALATLEPPTARMAATAAAVEKYLIIRVILINFVPRLFVVEVLDDPRAWVLYL